MTDARVPDYSHLFCMCPPAPYEVACHTVDKDGVSRCGICGKLHPRLTLEVNDDE